MKKKIIALLLAAVMVLTLLPMQAFAEPGALGGSHAVPVDDTTGTGTSSDSGDGIRVSLQFVEIDKPLEKDGYNTIADIGDSESFAYQSTGAMFDTFSKRLLYTEGTNYLYSMFHASAGEKVYLVPDNETEYAFLAIERTGYGKPVLGSWNNCIIQYSASEEEWKHNPPHGQGEGYYKANYKIADVNTFKQKWQTIADTLTAKAENGDIMEYTELRDMAIQNINDTEFRRLYLDYWKYLCDDIRTNGDDAFHGYFDNIMKGAWGGETLGMRTDEVNHFLKGHDVIGNITDSGVLNSVSCWIQVLQQYIFAELLNPERIGELDAYYETLNKQDIVTKIPVIYIESLVGMQPVALTCYVYTLGQLTSMAYNHNTEDAMLKNTSTARHDSIYGVLSQDNCHGMPTQYYTYGMVGMIDDPLIPRDQIHIGAPLENGWQTATKSNAGFMHPSCSSNESSIMIDSKSAICANGYMEASDYSAFHMYTGYSFYWSQTWTGAKSANIGLEHTAFWIDSDGATNGDHGNAENGTTTISRTAVPVDDDGYYVVTGKDNEAAVKWLREEAPGNSKYDQWWLKLKAKSSSLSKRENNATPTDIQSQGDETIFSPVSQVIGNKPAVSYSLKNTNVNYYSRLISREELIKFFEGDSVVTFTDTKFDSFIPAISDATYVSDSVVEMRVVPACEDQQPDASCDYPWKKIMDSGTWVADEKQSIFVDAGHIAGEGEYDVHFDQVHPRQYFDERIGFFQWDSNLVKKYPYWIGINISKLSDLTSAAKTLNDLGKITVTTSGYFFYMLPSTTNGFTKPVSDNYDTSTVRGQLLKKLAGSLEDIASQKMFLDTMPKDSSSSSVELTGDLAKEFINMITDPNDSTWYVTGTLESDTKQTDDAKIGGKFDVMVTWEPKTGGSKTYTLKPVNCDSVATIYPVGKSINQATAKYAVKAIPDAQEIPLATLKRSSYTLGDTVTSNGLTVHETAEVDTKFSIDPGLRTEYDKIAKSAESGYAILRLSRAEQPASGSIPDNAWVPLTLPIQTEGAIGAYSFIPTGVPGEYKYEIATGFGTFLNHLISSTSKVVWTDEFTDNQKFTLSLSKPEVTLCYKVDVEVLANCNLNGSILQTQIQFNGNPDRDTASWFVSADLIYDSVIQDNFAEIKHNEPMLERFEAMSGVPVTQNLYYSTGGHEFVIQSTYTFVEIGDAERKYTYDAFETACEDSWIESGDTSLACVQVQGTGCGTNHHGTFSEGGTDGASGTCKVYCDTLHTCTDSSHKNCAGHKCSGCKHTHEGKKDAVLNTAKDHPCQTSPTTWTKYTTESKSCTAGGSTVSWLMLKKEEVKCSGQGSGSYTVHHGVASDCKSVTHESDYHPWTHCICCCPKARHQECNPHTQHYIETWQTKLSGFKYIKIKNCRVWQLTANQLERNKDLLNTGATITGGLLPDESGIIMTKAPEIFFWAGDTDATKRNQCAHGRFLYFWHPEEYGYDIYGDITDDVSLTSTAWFGGTYAGDGAIRCRLYTDDKCDKGEENTYDQLHLQYLTKVRDDTGKTSDSWDTKGARFGGTVMSDFLILAENEKVNQAIYYKDYSVYAGADENTHDNAGLTLYDAAQFYKSKTKGDPPDPDYEISVSSCYRYDHYNNQNLNTRDIYYDKNGDPQVLWSVYGFWGGNPSCNAYEQATIEPDGIYIGGYNGKYSSYQNKYIGTGTTVTGTNIVSNFDFQGDHLFNKEWLATYREKRHPNDDNGYYHNTHPDDTYPTDITTKFRLGKTGLDIKNTAANRIYKFKSSYNFYEIKLNYRSDSSQPRYPVTKDKRFNKNGFSMSTYYTHQDEYLGYPFGRAINEVVVYVPMAADLDVEIKRFDSGPMKNVGFIDARKDVKPSVKTKFNLEADGWVHFPLRSYIKEGTRTSGLFNPIDTIEDITCYPQVAGQIGYGGMYGSGDPLDVTEWCKEKWITINNMCIVDTNGDGSFANEKVYKKNEKIRLDIVDSSGKPIEWYRMYIPTVAWESSNTRVDFYSKALNYPGSSELIANWEENNVDEWKVSNLSRYHGAHTTDSYQVVGRIGNLTMTDTGDFRFSNFFKNTLKGDWVIPNVVYKVNPSEQVRVVIDEYDIFGHKGGGVALWNTYGSQGYKETLPNDTSNAGDTHGVGSSLSHKPNYEIESESGTTRPNYYALPLVPQYNNIESYTDQPMRVGYAAYLDIETIGDYYYGDNYITVEWSYYGIEKGTNNYVPLDVYMVRDGKYELINNFDDDTPVYNYPIYMNWQDERFRRMQTSVEKGRTDQVEQNSKNEPRVDMYTGDRVGVEYYQPTKTSIYQGTVESAILGFDSRTFIGDEFYKDAVPGFNSNSHTDPGDYTKDWKYYASSQKWYFSNQLPSSAVFVKSNKECNEKTIEESQEKYPNIVVTGYIVAHGRVWDLVHDGTNSWTKLKEKFPPTDPDIPNPPTTPPEPGDPDPQDPNPPTTPDPPTVITIIPNGPNSRDDVTSSGTH